MLHITNPAAFVAPERLVDPCRCPECQSSSIVATGVLHIGHYKADNEVRQGLIWTCSDECFLRWEHARFMAQA